MKINISFEKWSPYYSLGQKLDFYIYIKFLECSYEEFYSWLDKNEQRMIEWLTKYDIDIAYSEKVIQLVKND